MATKAVNKCSCTFPITQNNVSHGQPSRFSVKLPSEDNDLRNARTLDGAESFEHEEGLKDETSNTTTNHTARAYPQSDNGTAKQQEVDNTSVAPHNSASALKDKMGRKAERENAAQQTLRPQQACTPNSKPDLASSVVRNLFHGDLSRTCQANDGLDFSAAFPVPPNVMSRTESGENSKHEIEIPEESETDEPKNKNHTE